MQPATAALHEALQAVPVKPLDETLHQCHGGRLWTWTLVMSWGASFHIEPSRGQCAAKEVLGTAPTGILVTDRYAGYHWVDRAQRQVCWAHLLRHFRRMGQRAGLPGALGRALLGMGQWMFRCLHWGHLAPKVERALREVVIHRKISCVTRSGRGVRFVERAFSVVHTCRQQGRSAFDFFYDSLDSYFHGPTPQPSLVPSG